MTDRSSLDRPAMVAALLLGLVLIGVSAPFTVKLWGEATDEFLTVWSEAEAASVRQAAATGDAEPTQATVVVGDFLTSSVVVTAPLCDDSFTAPLQEPAILSWTLRRETGSASEELAADSLQCSQAPDYEFVLAVAPQPDLGQISAASAAAARDDAWGRFSEGNETATYVLEFAWTRPGGPAGPLPLPAGQPGFSADLLLTVNAWSLEVREPESEALR